MHGSVSTVWIALTHAHGRLQGTASATVIAHTVRSPVEPSWEKDHKIRFSLDMNTRSGMLETLDMYE